MKPYKAALPLDTVGRIRGILLDLGLSVSEQHMGNDSMYYSCRVVIDNDNIGRFDIGTNGKGMSAEYALASAYAELMERLENRMLIYAIKYASGTFRQHNKELCVGFIPELSFRYFPDETFKELSMETLWEHCQKLLPNVAKYGKAQFDGQETYRMYYADFYNATKKETEHLPYHLIRLAASSTGLCAGNVPEEAILQGINEIFERYVLQQIYLQRLTPPTIPWEVFNGTEIQERLSRLKEEKEWVIMVKDCSLGKGFPVLGLLIIDRNTNRYTFRLGADLSPVIALQRCFTEAFQGADASDTCLQPICIDDDWNICMEHNQSVINGKGRFPHEVFANKPSWKFEGFALKEQSSYREDLCYIKGWLEGRGYTIYIRNNSFLGFPAYHVFVPGLSEVDAELYDVIADLKANNDGFFKAKPEYRLQNLDTKEKEGLIDKYKHNTSTEVSLFPYNANAFNRFSRQLMLALLSYSLGRDRDAYTFMDMFLKERECAGNTLEAYYYCVRDMFYAKTFCVADEEIIDSLATIYSGELVREVLSDMAERDGILKNFPLPMCFCCGECPVKDNCSYSTVICIEQKIQQKQKENSISQSLLGELFL